MAKKVSEVYQYAFRLHQQGEYEKALDVYKKIIVQCPNSRSAVMAKKRSEEIEDILSARLRRENAAKKAAAKQEKKAAKAIPTDADRLEIFPFLSGTVLCAGIILPLLIHLIISHMDLFAGTTTSKVFFLSSTGTSALALILAIVGFTKGKIAPKWRKRSLIWMILSAIATVIFFVLVILIQNQII